MKRSRPVLGAMMLTGLLLALVWISMPAKTQGTMSGLHTHDSPTSTQTAVEQPLARASNLVLIEFFAGY